MAKRPKKTQKSQAKLREFVVVVSTDDFEQAEDYKNLLKNNNIPAVIKKQAEQSINVKSIAVMVPEDLLDEAHVIIESQDAYDDFYDFALENEDEDDYDSDIFEEEF